MQLTQAPAPGARALIRDEEWIIQNADQCNFGGWQLSCIGVSETVRNRHALVLTHLEDITLIDPAKTELVYDESPTFVASPILLNPWKSLRPILTVPISPRAVLLLKDADSSARQTFALVWVYQLTFLDSIVVRE